MGQGQLIEKNVVNTQRGITQAVVSVKKSGTESSTAQCILEFAHGLVVPVWDRKKKIALLVKNTRAELLENAISSGVTMTAKRILDTVYQPVMDVLVQLRLTAFTVLNSQLEMI